jgi:hypothetical protein
MSIQAIRSKSTPICFGGVLVEVVLVPGGDEVAEDFAWLQRPGFLPENAWAAR